MRGPRPRVVLVTLAAELGGTWKHVVDLAAGLKATDVEVSVCVPAGAQALLDDLARRGIAVGNLRRELLRGRSVMHLHLHNSLSLRATLVLLARRPFGRAVITEHLPRTDATDPTLTLDRRSPGAASAKKLLKLLQFRLVSQVIAVSSGSAKFLAERYGLSRTAVTIVRHGLVSTHPHPQIQIPDRASNEQGEALRVVAVGALIRQKGFDVLVDSGQHARSPWNVEIFGAGPQSAPLTARVAAATNGRVQLKGWTDEVAHKLLTAEVLVMPSRWESAGYAAMEAMMQGLPVVASEVDGLDEIVVNGVTGVLVPPGDPAALAAALDHLADNRKLLSAMGNAGREQVAHRFTLDRMIAETMRVYQLAQSR